MSKRRRSYTKAEKLEIVKLSIETDQKIKDLADRFEVSQNAIYTWRKAFVNHKASSFLGKGKLSCRFTTTNRSYFISIGSIQFEKV